MNALAHTFMYMHYAGHRLIPRRVLTGLQTTQHVIMCTLILRSFVAPAAPCARDATGNIVPLVLYLFFGVEFGRLLCGA